MNRSKLGFGSKLFELLQATPAFQIVSAFAILISIVSSLDTLNIAPIVYYAGLLVVLITLVSSALTIRKRLTASHLPEPTGLFIPFASAKDWEPWQRENVTNSLADAVLEHPNKHVLVVSPSGTGKSVMMNVLLPRKLKEFTPVHIDNYSDILERLLAKIGSLTTTPEIVARIEQVIFALTDLEPDYDKIRSELNEILPLALEGKKLVFLFDQVERYFIQSEKNALADYQRHSARNEIIKEILGVFSRNDQVYSVFAIRSEYVFGSLISLFNTKLNGTEIEEFVSFYFLWGVNAHDDSSEYLKIFDYLSDRFGGREFANQIGKIANIRNRQRANTFLLNLVGYLFEHLGTNPKYQKRLLDASLTDIELIDIYLDAAFEGYVASGVPYSRSHFDSVLLALASENKYSGTACSMERLSGLSHYPSFEVEQTIEYLCSISLVEEDTHDGETVFRINHEKISDRILRSDRLMVKPRGLDGVRYLTENKIPTAQLTKPKSFPNAIEVKAEEFFSLSYLPVVLFVAFGCCRMLFPHEINQMLMPINNLVTNLTGFSPPDYYVDPIFYAPHFIAHVAWVSYIDRMNRSFIRYVDSSFLAKSANGFALLGAILGVAVAFIPQLFVIPIVVVGFLYGILLFFISKNGRFGGEMEIVTRLWGVRSAVNVVVVLILGLASAEFFSGVDRDLSPVQIEGVSHETILLSAIIVVSSLLIWFWHHIGAEQNTRRVWSSNLALFDKGRHDLA